MAMKPTPKAKPKGLNDFLKEGKTPPSKNKKLPSDADVILKGYNDKKTIAKEKLKADMKSGKMKRVESGMTGAMVAKAAGKVISKIASKSAAKSTAKALKAVNKPTDKTAKVAAKVEKRALKAANKPVSKNNRNVGGPVLTGILKRSEPARANRTRLGNTTKKSK